MSLSDDVLFGRYDRTLEMKRETYEKILGRCRSIIRQHCEMGRQSCYYQVPPFLLGAAHPIIDIPTCAEYVTSHISRENPKIRAVFRAPNIIYFDWHRG